MYTCKLTSKWAISLGIEHMWVTVLFLFALYRCSLLCFLGTNLEWKQPSMYRRWLGYKTFWKDIHQESPLKKRPSQRDFQPSIFRFSGANALLVSGRNICLRGKNGNLGHNCNSWIFPFRRFSLSIYLQYTWRLHWMHANAYAEYANGIPSFLNIAWNSYCRNIFGIAYLGSHNICCTVFLSITQYVYLQNYDVNYQVWSSFMHLFKHTFVCNSSSTP